MLRGFVAERGRELAVGCGEVDDEDELEGCDDGKVEDGEGHDEY